jgi:hypothetical protein
LLLGRLSLNVEVGIFKSRHDGGCVRWYGEMESREEGREIRGGWIVMLNQQEREGVIVYSASVGGRWVCLCIFVDRGQINAESEPVQQRECSDKGVSTSGIIAGVNKNVSKFFDSEAIQQ